MTASDARQAARILRNLKSAERGVFTVIEEVRHDAADEYDWEGIMQDIETIMGQLAIARDLAKNSLAEKIS